MKPRALRALGLVAGAVWASLALLERGAWPVVGLAMLCVFAVVALVVRQLPFLAMRLLMAPPWRVFVGACAFVAAATSWWLVRSLLRDTPLSIDAAVYLAQARAMSHLHFGMPAPRPMQAFSNHFFSEGPDGLLYGVFPPGWPLAIVPFLWLRQPMLVGPVVAGLLVVAQAVLGRALGRAAGEGEECEVATRASLLLGLPSVGRAFETADLLSHAFVALVAVVGIACALDARGEGTPGRARAIVAGACVGWAFASRLLDGVLLAAAVGVALGWRRRGGLRALAWAAAGAAPFALLLAIEQRCATGAWLLPTQASYFARSDWPPGCHRLGLGADIGCSVEHKGIVAHYGPAGYDIHQALRVVRDQAGKVGEDLLSFPPLALLGFLPVVLGASAIDALVVAFVLCFTLAYGLFYYGNAQFFGARHLFPIAPFLWLLVARGTRSLPHRATAAGRWFDAAHVRGAGVVTLLAVAVVAAHGPWAVGRREATAWQKPRSDLRRTLSSQGFERAILKTPDETAVAAAFDPWEDRSDRLFVLDDGSGLVELRRAHPDLPLLLSLPEDKVGKLYPRPVAQGILVELERPWPTFVRPAGLGPSRARRTGASGGAVLLLSHARPGAAVEIPFETALDGDYLVRVDGLKGPSGGDYALALDGEPLAAWSGYAPEHGPARGASVEREVSPGRHVLVATCMGRDAQSSGYDAELDALVGDLPPSP